MTRRLIACLLAVSLIAAVAEAIASPASTRAGEALRQVAPPPEEPERPADQDADPAAFDGETPEPVEGEIEAAVTSPPVNTEETEPAQNNLWSQLDSPPLVAWLLIALSVAMLAGLAVVAVLTARSLSMLGQRRAFLDLDAMPGETAPADTLVMAVQQLARICEHLRQDVRRLEDDVQELRAARAPGRPERRYVDVGPLSPPPDQRARAPVAEPPGPDIGPDPRRATLEASFTAALGRRQSLEAFAAENDARVIKDGRISAAPGMEFVWAVDLGTGDLALLPGVDLAMDFGMSYCAQRSMPEDVKAAFDFDIDQTRSFRLIRSARGRIGHDGGLVVTQKGMIGGLID